MRVRYAKAAQAREQSLCCPVDYDKRFLEAIPGEVIERDYGCGDPSRYLKTGETVLDLGSGTGKICFIASQVVGPKGRVIGVDMTDDMLEVARRNAPVVAENVGYSNVEFRKGRIQDLKLDLEALDETLEGNPVGDANGFLSLEARVESLRAEKPMIEDASIDAIVSNCVLNLVDADKKRLMFAELHRVLKNGGRAIISDIVSDQPVSDEMMKDPELWSGCLSGAMTETEFLEAFEEAGFHGIHYRKFDIQPWRVIEGIVFRSVTIEAFKNVLEPSSDLDQTVIYNGPFKRVEDDDGRLLERGKRYVVSDRVFESYQRNPYAESFTHIESKVTEYRAISSNGDSCCSDEGSCC